MKKTMIVGLLTLLAGAASAEVSVIVHPSNSSSLTASDIKQIYLNKKKKFGGGASIEPVGLDPKASATEEFNKKVLGKNANQVKSYWSKLVFTGKGKPPKVMSAKDAIEFVAKNPAGIAYVESSEAQGAAVKVVSSF